MERYSVVKNSMKVDMEDTVQQITDILEKNDGRTFEEKKAEVIQYLQTQTDTLLTEEPLSVATENEMGTGTKLEFWKQGAIIRVTDAIVLRDVEKDDRESFIKLQCQNLAIESMLKEEACRNILWEEHIASEALMCSILNSGIYVGYCGIKNLAHEKWEIAVEILEEWRKQGIGYAAVKVMIYEIKKRLGVTEFKVRVEPNNYASQRLFEKLGAVPNGISEFLLHRKEEIERYEEENLNLIDDELIAVAKKFKVEPRRLLSHVLEYKLTI